MICSKCKTDKPSIEFYASPKEKRCKSCMAEKYKRWVTSEKGHSVRLASSLKFSRSEKGKIVSRRGGKTYRAKPENRDWDKFRDKRNARLKVFHALRSGKIKKKCCKECGSVDTQGHHEDYSKPLEVIWLCPMHHTQIHLKKKKEINNVVFKIPE